MSMLIKQGDLPLSSQQGNGAWGSETLMELHSVISRGIESSDDLPWDDEDNPVEDHHSSAFQDAGWTDANGYRRKIYHLVAKKSEIPWADFLEKGYIPRPVFKADGSLDTENSRFFVMRGSAGFAETSQWDTVLTLSNEGESNEFHYTGGSYPYTKEGLSVTLKKNTTNKTVTINVTGAKGWIAPRTYTITNPPGVIYFELTGAGGGGCGLYNSTYPGPGGGSGGTLCGILRFMNGSSSAHEIHFELGIGGAGGWTTDTSTHVGRSGGGSYIRAFDSDGENSWGVFVPGGGGASRTASGSTAGVGGAAGDFEYFIYDDEWDQLSENQVILDDLYIRAICPGKPGGVSANAGGTQYGFSVSHLDADTYETSWIRTINDKQQGGTSVSANGQSPGGGGGASCRAPGGNGRGSSSRQYLAFNILPAHGTMGSGGGGCGGPYTANGDSNPAGGWGGNGCLKLFFISMQEDL